jgi:hypothetical protein
MSFDSRRSFSHVTRIFVAALLVVAMLDQQASAQTLVTSPFVTGFEGWQDTYVTQPTQVGGAPSWGVLLTPDPISTQRFLMETGDGREADSVAGDGLYKPYILINSLDTTPANYTVTAQLATLDNDGFGLVFGYQDNNNYFRVGFRDQASGLGFPRGTSVQKVVGGVITQLGIPSLVNVPLTNGTPFETKIVVTGTNYDIQTNTGIGGAFTSIHSGSDASLQPGKYGVHSWAQHELSTAVPNYGTVVGPISIASTTLNKTTNFTNVLTGVVPWRRLVMTDQNGETGFETTENVLEDHGNFMLDFTKGVIRDDSNGNKNATTSAANVDFIGPAIVVDTPAAAAMTDYRYAVRVENRDNDGIGLLFRVAGDNSSFYRVNWNTEGPAVIGAVGPTRPPIGMSVQKYKGGFWSEIYRDTQTSPVFLPADSVPFDVSIQAVGNQFKIDVLADPNGTPTAYSYPVIADNSGDPILSGSVGFTNWGNGEGGNGAVYSAHSGNSTSLVTALSALLDLDLVVNRDTGNVSLVNNAASFAAIKGVTILSDGGTVNPANWLSISDNYDEAPGNGSVDNNDPWTELTFTDFSLSERENSGGNGGTINGAQSVNLGNFWRKSQIEDLVLSIELTNGNFVVGEVSYINGPSGNSYSRSDLNADGSVNPTDWGFFFPNMLTDISAQSGYQRAIKGDLDLDGDNDVADFVLFKTDYDVANGAGAFNAMLAGVPEPSTVMLVLLATFAACASRSKRRVKSIAVCLGVAAAVSLGSTAHAVPLDFTTFQTAAYPHGDSDAITTTDFFPVGVWAVTPTTATHNSNSDSSVLHTPTNVVNKRITGTLTPGTDDDVVGFVVGFEPGEQLIGATGEYFLIDWKGASQGFDITDFASPGFTPFHNLTGTGNMPVGLALSRVTGSANGDELWQHADLSASPTGGVTQLARGATLGSTAYDRTGGSHLFEFSITDHELFVKVDGVEQFSFGGNYAPGRFGLYTFAQGPPANFADFDMVDYPGDIPILRATVDRSNGNITINNSFAAAVPFDFYQFSSATSSLNALTWNSLHDQNFQPAGAGDHQKWQEAGGSSSSAIAEVFLDGNSNLAGSTSQTIGGAYNNSINGEDLVFQYRLVTGEMRTGFVQYIGVAPGVPGDYNGNGVVDGADYVLWRNGGPLQNEVDNPGTVNAADYTAWRSRFGNTSGSGAGLGGAAGVPEPATLGIGLCVGMMLLARRFRAA